MTLLQAAFTYGLPIGDRELRAVDRLREVYGIWALKFDERTRKITVDYDASRLSEFDIVFMLRNAGIRLIEPARKIA